jgi:cysteine desulfurase
LKQIYLDYNSTTPLDERVLEAMLPYLKSKFGNASSLHNFGREAKAGLEESREKVASLIGAEPSEIYFTSGGTEADNLALKGIALSKQGKRNHIIISAIEHHAILESAKYLEKNGFRVDFLGVDKEGIIHESELKDKIDDQTSIVSIMQANNEVGTIQNIRRLADLAHERGAIFHTDAVQAVGKIKVNVKDLDIDLLSLSAHKFCGPKGVGVLFLRKGIKISPLSHGGHHEKGRRAGTENVAGAVGLGAALELAYNNLENEHERLSGLADFFIDRVQSSIEDVFLNGPRENSKRVPSTVNLSFQAVEGESIILSLDMKGVGVASGSACTSGSLEASHVLTAMGVPAELAQGSIRFSMGRFTTKEDLEYTASVLPEIIERLRAMSPLYNKGR